MYGIYWIFDEFLREKKMCNASGNQDIRLTPSALSNDLFKCTQTHEKQTHTSAKRKETRNKQEAVKEIHFLVF